MCGAIKDRFKAMFTGCIRTYTARYGSRREREKRCQPLRTCSAGRWRKPLWLFGTSLGSGELCMWVSLSVYNKDSCIVWPGGNVMNALSLCVCVRERELNWAIEALRTHFTRQEGTSKARKKEMDAQLALNSTKSSKSMYVLQSPILKTYSKM